MPDDNIIMDVRRLIEILAEELTVALPYEPEPGRRWPSAEVQSSTPAEGPQAKVLH